mmetsp:Transcript_75703/g.201138  ORF Transcript_75703/g.201138 Transcript_75703/m.201138 type:complete len:210 (-) Transcript_75703:440-1069(-)
MTGSRQSMSNRLCSALANICTTCNTCHRWARSRAMSIAAAEGSSPAATVPVYMRESRRRRDGRQQPLASMTFRRPSRMPLVASMALRTGEAPRKTLLCTRTCPASSVSSTPSHLVGWQPSSGPCRSSTRMATSADSVSSSTRSQVSTTPSDTARLARQAELERMSMASSMASRSSFQSAASVILMARSAAKRHWKADFSAKTMLLVSLR